MMKNKGNKEIILCPKCDSENFVIGHVGVGAIGDLICNNCGYRGVFPKRMKQSKTKIKKEIKNLID